VLVHLFVGKCECVSVRACVLCVAERKRASLFAFESPSLLFFVYLPLSFFISFTPTHTLMQHSLSLSVSVSGARVCLFLSLFLPLSLSVYVCAREPGAIHTVGHDSHSCVRAPKIRLNHIGVQCSPVVPLCNSHVAVCCNMLQCVAVCCSGSKCGALLCPLVKLI
jgi:hypothetical protein